MMLLLVFALLIPTVLSCPPADSIKPCECKWDFDAQIGDVYCSGLDNEYDLQNVAQACRYRKGLHLFSIDNSMLNYIPQDTFSGVRFKSLEILNSSIGSLSDTDRALEGLEEDLNKIIIKDSVFYSQWSWSKLKYLKNLLTLELSGVALQSIYRDIEEISELNVNKFKFSNNDISYIYDRAFTKFKSIVALRLPNNKISVVKRQMLPNPATMLERIDLGHNLIEQFPPDLFTEMPKLRILSINDNKILTLQESTFSPIWEQLKFLEAIGNDLRCDCRLSWMLQKNKLQGLKAFCAEPQTVKGKDLRELTSLDLWC